MNNNQTIINNYINRCKAVDYAMRNNSLRLANLITKYTDFSCDNITISVNSEGCLLFTQK